MSSLINTASREGLDDLRGQVITPDDAGYDQARTVFYGDASKRPNAIVRVDGVTDVQRVVAAARENGQELALTDGLWLDLLVRPESMKREQAWRITMSYLADAFPRHFQQPGLQARE